MVVNRKQIIVFLTPYEYDLWKRVAEFHRRTVPKQMAYILHRQLDAEMDIVLAASSGLKPSPELSLEHSPKHSPKPDDDEDDWDWENARPKQTKP